MTALLLQVPDLFISAQDVGPMSVTAGPVNDFRIVQVMPSSEASYFRPLLFFRTGQGNLYGLFGVCDFPDLFQGFLFRQTGDIHAVYVIPSSST